MMFVHASFTYIFARIFQVFVVHSRRYHPCAREHSESGVSLAELAWQKTGEFALDKFGTNSLR
jgi:hypothetical protein